MRFFTVKTKHHENYSKHRFFVHLPAKLGTLVCGGKKVQRFVNMFKREIIHVATAKSGTVRFVDDRS